MIVWEEESWFHVFSFLKYYPWHSNSGIFVCIFREKCSKGINQKWQKNTANIPGQPNPLQSHSAVPLSWVFKYEMQHFPKPLFSFLLRQEYCVCACAYMCVWLHMCIHVTVDICVQREIMFTCTLFSKNSWFSHRPCAVKILATFLVAAFQVGEKVQCYL